MRTRTAPLAILALASITLLSGCSFSLGTPSSSASDFENTVEDALDNDYKADCGSDDITLVEDDTVDCTVTNKDTDTEYDAEAEITSVDGDKYKINVTVDEDSADPPADEQTDDEGDSDDNADAVTVPGSDIATLAAQALESSLGFYADDMACDSDEVEIYEGNYEYCYFTDPSDGTSYVVDVEIDSFDSATGEYHITAEVVG